MDTPRVTAVVTAYWEPRFAQVERIVFDIMNGSVKPDTIMVLNNNPQWSDKWREVRPYEWDFWDVKVLSGINTETRGKYIAGMLSYADYYLLMDDDMSVRPRTLEYLLAKAFPGVLTANRGIQITDDVSYFRGQVIDAHNIQQDIVVDSICGSGVFCGHGALVNILAAESKGGLRNRWPTQGDDILAGLANPGQTVIFPMHGEEGWEWLEEQGVAMNHAPGYYEMRDRFCYEALEALA